jgi:hypothetical protein
MLCEQRAPRGRRDGRRLIALAFAVVGAATALALAVPARADDTDTFTTNYYFNCRGDHGIGVPNGKVLVLRTGWQAKTRGLAQDFVNAHHMDVVIDGVSVNGDPYWQEPTQQPDGTWIAWWLYNTGRTVTFDTPFTLEVTASLSHPVLDGMTFEGPDNSKPLFTTTGIDSDGPCFVGAF